MWFQVTQIRVGIISLICEETIVSLYNFLKLHVYLKLKRTVLRSEFLPFFSSAFTFFLQFYGQELTLEPGFVSQLCSLIPGGLLSFI